MSLSDDVANDVQTAIDTLWSKRLGRKIPETGEVALAGGAVEIEATFLYADMAASSKMAKELDRRIAAKIIKSFLATSARMIRSCGGKIMSFDGDRIMGVFYGSSKNSDAARCALKIKYTVHKVIRPKFKRKYNAVTNASFAIDHGVGVDTGTVLAVRGGARGSNDLIWIGRAPNLAAKLSDLREPPYQSFITASVFNKLNDASKYGGANNEIMWESRTWEFLGENLSIYRSKWTWEP